MKRTPCVRQRSTSVCWEYWKNRLRSETSGIVAVSICSASPVMWLLSHTTSLSARPALLAAEKPIRLGRTNGGPGSGARPIFSAAARSLEPTLISPWKPIVSSGPVGGSVTPSCTAARRISSHSSPKAFFHAVSASSLPVSVRLGAGDSATRAETSKVNRS